MNFLDFDIDSYNKNFLEKTRDYTKMCKGKPCEFADGKCTFAVFCSEGPGKVLNYIPGIRTGGDIFSFKSLCLRDEFPDGGYSLEMLKEFRSMALEEFPEATPDIQVWIDELKEIGMYKEEI